MRIVTTSTESAHLLGYAKQQLAALRSRLPSGAIFSKHLPVREFLVSLYLSPAGDTIVLSGGGQPTSMLLSGVSGTWLYDYMANRLTFLDEVRGALFQTGIGHISQQETGNEGRCLGRTLRPPTAVRTEGLPAFTHAAYAPLAQQGALLAGMTLHSLVGATTTPSCTFDAAQDPLGLAPLGAEAAVLFAGREAGWNHVRAVNSWAVDISQAPYTVDPEDFTRPYHWQWVPRIYRVWSGAAIDPSGLHYLAIQKASRGYGDINPEGPYTQIDVEFVCLLDDRSGAESCEGGVAERLKLTAAVDSQAAVTECPRVEVYFTEGLYEPGPTDFYKNEELYTVGYGSALTPPQHLFSIDYEHPLGHAIPPEEPVPGLAPTAEISVCWWKSADGAHGVLGAETTGAKRFYLHRFSEQDVTEIPPDSADTWVPQYGALLYSGEGFKDVTYSVTGTVCAVVYDLTEAETTESHILVLELATGLVLVDRRINGQVFEFGQLFLLREEVPALGEDTREPVEKEEVPVVAAPAEREKGLEYSLYGFGHFKDRHRGGHLGGWKLSIDSVVASAVHWADVCWDSVYLKHDSYRNPIGTGAAEEYEQLLFRESEVHTTPEGTSTTTWHYLTGGIQVGPFHTLVDGQITLPPWGTEPINTYEYTRFGIYFYWDGGCIFVSGNTAPPYDITNTTIHDYCRTADPYHCGDNNLRLTDNCGETYEIERELSEVTVGGDVLMGLYSGYAAAGGLAPYELTASCGEMESGIMTSIEGCCGSETVTGTDSCGGSASMETFVDIGQWVQVQFGDPPPTTRVRQILVSGNTMTEFTYVGAGIELSTEYSDGLGNCYPSDGQSESTCSGQVATCRSICGWTAGTPGIESLPGSVSLITDNYSVSPWCAGYMSLVTGKYITYGAVCWAVDNKYTNVWNWECP